MEFRGNYILDGHDFVEEPDLIKWAQWFETADRHIKKTTLQKDEEKPVVISTVFLGIDHAFRNGPPVLFETMVFEGPMDGECNRYCTWEEAEKGHEEIVSKVMKVIE